MALTDENNGTGIPATMLVGPATFGNNAMPYYPYPVYANNGGNNGGGMVDELRELMEDAPNETIKREMQRLVDKIEQQM